MILVLVACVPVCSVSLDVVCPYRRSDKCVAVDILGLMVRTVRDSRDPLRIAQIQSDEPVGFSASRGRELFVGEGGNLHVPFVIPGEGRAAHHNMAAEKQARREVICRSPQ